MKKIFAIIALLFSVSTFAQNSNPAPYSLFGQMLNTSNSYAYATNDTSTGTLYLYTSKYNSSGLPAVTPVIGTGTISFVVSTLKGSTTSTVNPTVTTTPQASFDGTNWATIPGVTVSTLTPTSASVAVTTMWEFSDNYGLYYRLKNVVTNDTASIKAWYLLNKNTEYSIK